MARQTFIACGNGAQSLERPATGSSEQNGAQPILRALSAGSIPHRASEFIKTKGLEVFDQPTTGKGDAFRPFWAEDVMRLDPLCLPQKVSFTRFANGGKMSAVIDKNGVLTLKNLIPGTAPATLMVPYRCFQSVAARIIAHTQGKFTITLELRHQNMNWCVPLRVARDFDNVAEDWRNWAELFKLPMVMLDDHEIGCQLEEHRDNIRPRCPQARDKRFSESIEQQCFLGRIPTRALGVRMRIESKNILAAAEQKTEKSQDKEPSS